jgi:hypothetical protein
MKGYAASKSGDSLFIGLDGTCVGALRETPSGCSGTECDPFLNTWLWTNTIQNGINTIDVGTAGPHTLNIWVRERDHLVDGIYITQGTETPTGCGTTTLFTGSETEAQSVDTTGWTDGEKDLEVTGDDATCGTPLPPASDTFIFESGSVTPPDTTITEPAAGETLSATPYSITGTATAGTDALQKVQVSTDGGGTWVDATGTTNWSYNWDLPSEDYVGHTIMAKAIDVNSIEDASPASVAVQVDTVAPSGVSNATPADGAVDQAVDTNVTATAGSDGSGVVEYNFEVAEDAGFTSGQQQSGWQAGTSYGPVLANNTTYYWRVNARDAAGNEMGNTAAWSFTTLDAGCTETGSITIASGQTLSGNPIDLTSIVTTSNATNLVYTVTEGSCDVDPNGTYIEGRFRLRQRRAVILAADI